MTERPPIRILLVENDEEAVRLVTKLLVSEDERRFRLTAVKDMKSALAELSGREKFDLVLLEFSLSDGGTGTVEDLREKDARIPVIFLGARKELGMAVEAMRIGGRDFLPKEDLDAHVFPQTLKRHHEQHQLEARVEELEIKRGRLEAMQGMVVNVSEQISDPIENMRKVLRSLEERNSDEKSAKYLSLIRENLDRMTSKLEKLKNLKDDKTVKYIKDIRMIDLS